MSAANAKTNTRKKGQKHVNEAIKIFEEYGFTCWKPGSKARFIGPGKVISQSQDILGAFDFIAIRWDKPIVFVQVTTISEKGDETGTATTRRKKIDGLPLNAEHSVLVVMGRRPRKKWTIWQCILSVGWMRLQIPEEGTLEELIR